MFARIPAFGSLGLLSLAACGGHALLPIESECPPGLLCEQACAAPSCGDASAAAPPPASQPRGGEDAGAWPTDDAASPSSSLDYPDGSIEPTSATTTVLAYDVVDAKFSAPLNSLVIVSDAPASALHLFNPTLDSDTTIPLPTTPVAVAVDATGLFAAVAYDAHVSWIDLQARTIKNTCALSSDASGVALTTSGVAYVAPMTDQWVALHAIDLGTCAETLESQLYAGARVALDPSEHVLFATQDLDPSSILRCDLTANPVDCEDAEDGADWGTYDFGNSVWPSADGARLYSGGPATLLVPADGGVLTYGGSFGGLIGVQSLSEAPQAGRVAVVPAVDSWGYGPAPASDDTAVRVYDTQYLGLVAQYQLPIAVGGPAPDGIVHGKFVFSTVAMHTLFVLAQRESDDGGLGEFVEVTMVP